MERYTAEVFYKAIQKLYIYVKSIDYEIILNAHIRSRFNKRYELDVVVRIENLLYWIECKSGNFDEQDIKKYSSLNELFGLDDKHSFCVVCDNKNKHTKTYDWKYNINIINISEFNEKFISRIIIDDCFLIKNRLQLKISNE